MNILIAFFGFIRRSIIEINEVNQFVRLFPENTTFQIVVFAPNKLNEFDDSPLEKQVIKDIQGNFLQNKQIKTIDFHYYNYSPFEFIQKAVDLSLPQKTVYQLYPYRILSLQYSISGLAKTIIQYNYKYDFVIFTRFDIFGSIESLGSLERFKEENSIYTWRLIETTLWNQPPEVKKGYAEDMVFICSKEVVDYLTNLYDSGDVIYPNLRPDEIVSEYILGKYLYMNNTLKIYPLTDVIYKKPMNSKNKYSHEFEKKINDLYNRCMYNRCM